MPDSNRVGLFRTLQMRIESANVDDDKEFRTLLADAQELLEMSDQELADALRVSRPTVNRWIRGRNLPHIALRRPIFAWVSRQLSERMKRLEVFAHRVAV